jgi:cobalt/nickel transport system permease protein
LGRMDTPVHRLDARAKSLVTLVFVGVVMSFPRYTLSALAPFLLYPVVLCALGRIPARQIVKRMLVAAPFVLVVGMFNPLLDRQPVAVIGPWVVTGGWVSYASILCRFILTVWAALALVACTGMYRLGAGLEQVGMPRGFVVQLLFLHRYLFVISDEGGRMLRSVQLRAPGMRSLGLRAYAALVGHLLLRSMDRADRVYRAMVARGFDGQIRVVRRSTFGWPEAVFVGGWLAFFGVARVWNLADALGRLLTGGAL